MQRILFWILLLWAGQWLWRRHQRRTAGQADASRHGAAQGFGAARGPRPAPPPQLAEPMVRCAECGTHAPVSESVQAGSRYFCGAEHARRYAARPVGRDAR